MRLTISLTMILLSAYAYAQPALVTMNDGSVKEVQIQAHSTTQLFTKAGNIDFVNIKGVQFQTEPTEGLSAILKKNAITVSIGSFTISSPIIVQPVQKKEIEMVDFEKFTNQRNAGKALELIGVAAIAVASYLQIKYSNDFADDAKKNPQTAKLKQVSPYIPVAGLGVMAVGIGIDIGASRHLRKR